MRTAIALHSGIGICQDGGRGVANPCYATVVDFEYSMTVTRAKVVFFCGWCIGGLLSGLKGQPGPLL